MTNIDSSLGGSLMDPADVAKASSIESGMAEAGRATSTPVQAEYFGTDETYKIMFPDGITFIEAKRLNEGDRRQYQAAIQKDVRVQKATGDAFMRMSSGEERAALIECAAVGWNLVKAGKQVGFSKGSPGSSLAQWLTVAPPEIVDLVEKEIRLHEPWTMGELTVADIDKQIAELGELREAKVKEEEGKGH